MNFGSGQLNKQLQRQRLSSNKVGSGQGSSHRGSNNKRNSSSSLNQKLEVIHEDASHRSPDSIPQEDNSSESISQSKESEQVNGLNEQRERRAQPYIKESDSSMFSICDEGFAEIQMPNIDSHENFLDKGNIHLSGEEQQDLKAEVVARRRETLSQPRNIKAIYRKPQVPQDEHLRFEPKLKMAVANMAMFDNFSKNMNYSNHIQEHVKF